MNTTTRAQTDVRPTFAAAKPSSAPSSEAHAAQSLMPPTWVPGKADMQLGALVRSRRQAAGLTLDELATRSGVSRAMLSDVEREAKSPTIRVLKQIGDGLCCSISELVGGNAPASELRHTPAAKVQILVDPETEVERRSLIPSVAVTGLEWLHYTMPPGATLGLCPARPSGHREVLHVLKGRVRYESVADSFDVRKGDVLDCPVEAAHTFRNIGRGEAEFMYLIDTRAGF